MYDPELKLRVLPPHRSGRAAAGFVLLALAALIACAVAAGGRPMSGAVFTTSVHVVAGDQVWRLDGTCERVGPGEGPVTPLMNRVRTDDLTFHVAAAEPFAPAPPGLHPKALPNAGPIPQTLAAGLSGRSEEQIQALVGDVFHMPRPLLGRIALGDERLAMSPTIVVICAGILALLMELRAFGPALRQRRFRRGRCPLCRYSLEAHACPECGVYFVDPKAGLDEHRETP